MKKIERKSLIRESGAIILLAMFLSLVYNTFSSRSISVIRTTPKGIAVPDSVLFSQTNRSISPEHHMDADSVDGNENDGIMLQEKSSTSDISVEKIDAQEDHEGYKIVSLKQVKRLLAEGYGFFIDARSAQDYLEGHIKGAHSIPAMEVDNYFEELVMIPRDTLIVIYCNNPECHLGRSITDFMVAMEFTNLYLYDDGWDGWMDANMPVDTTLIPFRKK